MKNNNCSFLYSRTGCQPVLKGVVCLLILMYFCDIQAQRVFDVFFDRNDFVTNLSDNIVSINTSRTDATYSDDTGKPAIPLFTYKILLPQGLNTLPYNVSFEKNIVCTGVDIERNSPAITTNGVVVGEICDSLSTWDTPVWTSSIISFGPFKYICLIVTPFVYELENRKLFFVSHISISIPSFPDTVGNSLMDDWPLAQRDIAETLANPEDLEIFYQVPNHSINQAPVDYLIITSPSLANSFQELANWKRRKGYHTEIVTTDSIYSSFSGIDNPQKIKGFINQCRLLKNTKFVLLGGDDVVVPSKLYNFDSNPFSSSYQVPIDIYYSCFSDYDTTDWDKNGNGICGEQSDSIDFTPSVYLSRIPLRTPQQVSDYTAKLIRYEMGYDINAANRLFLAGRVMENYHNTAKFYNNYLFEHYIQPYWSGERFYLYEDECFLPENDGEGFNLPLFVNELNRGYNTVHETSHGEWNCWVFGDSIYYRVSDAIAQTNIFPSVIVTNACHTNAFHKEICLSEAFLRNTNGGAVAYFGSSTYGYSTDKLFEGSFMYNAFFFEHLLKGIPYDAPYTFGGVATRAKQGMIDYFGTFRFNQVLQLGINPIGDPEMPIFTESPKSFDITGDGANTPIVMINPSQMKISVTSTVGGCKIVLLEDNGNIQVVDNTQQAIFDTHYGNHKITILKHNYIPYMAEVALDSIPPFVGPITFNIRHDGSLCTITPRKTTTDQGFYYSEGLESECVDGWRVKVLNLITGETKVDTDVDTPSYTCNTSAWQSGFYIVTGIVNGFVGQKKIIVNK